MSDDTEIPDTAGGPDEPDPARGPLDVFIFAPVGVVLTVVEDLPGLIAKGRQRMELEISNARAVGRFVVRAGQKDVLQRVDRLWQKDSASPPAPDGTDDAGRTPGPPAATPKPAPDPVDSAVVEQAFAGYDTQSASQVVRRLESLTAEQLHAVHRYEASHRNRRTILNRTQQLLEHAPPAQSDGSDQ